MSAVIDFIFVDDEDISNLISRLTVETTLGKGTRTQSFRIPKDALEYLKTFQPRCPKVKTVLLLDINMPGMSGWEFLEEFDRLTFETRQAISIYVLSSSVDPRDKQRTYANKNVVDYLVKPLALDTVNLIARSARAIVWAA